jgi:hypothetical protein
MRLGVSSDVHSHLDRLLRVQDAMNTVGVEERGCPGDVVGGWPDPRGVIDALRDWPLVLGGNHDAWLLGGRGGQRSEPVTEFLNGRVAARELPLRAPGTPGLVGDTHSRRRSGAMGPAHAP